MGNLAPLLTGLAQGLNSYLGGQQRIKELEAYQGNKQQDMLERQMALLKEKESSKTSSETYVTPEMMQGLFEKVSPEMGQAASKFVSDYNAKNPSKPLTWDQATKGLGGMLDKISTITTNKNKPSPKHYMGNDPKGNAIFSDNTGKMFGPDGSEYNGKVLPKSSTMPTSTTRSSAEFATSILPHITEMRDLIKQADEKGYIGPASGRIYNQFMAGKVGSTGNDDADRLLGKLRAMDSLLKTGAMRVHFGARGGQNMYEHFSELLNSGKQSASMLNGSLDTLENFMTGYASAGGMEPNPAPSEPMPNTPPAPMAAPQPKTAPTARPSLQDIFGAQ